MTKAIKEFKKDGVLHREDGPALIWRDGQKFWYLNGKSCTQSAKRVIDMGYPEEGPEFELIWKMSGQEPDHPISSYAVGQQWLDSSSNELRIWDGSSWAKVSP